MKKIKKIIVSIMLVFVLGTGMNITSTFNTVDVRAASVEKTEDEKIWRDSEKFAEFIKDEIKISYKKENCTAEVISETPWEDDATMYIIQEQLQHQLQHQPPQHRQQTILQQQKQRPEIPHQSYCGALLQ